MTLYVSQFSLGRIELFQLRNCLAHLLATPGKDISTFFGKLLSSFTPSPPWGVGSLSSAVLRYVVYGIEWNTLSLWVWPPAPPLCASHSTKDQETERGFFCVPAIQPDRPACGRKTGVGGGRRRRPASLAVFNAVRGGELEGNGLWCFC